MNKKIKIFQFIFIVFTVLFGLILSTKQVKAGCFPSQCSYCAVNTYCVSGCCVTNPPAQGGSITNPVLPSSLGSNPDSFSFLQNAIPAIITILFVVGSVVFLFMFIIGAIQWISSGGDKQALEGARGRITNALIGIVILFATFAIIRLIEHFFGISILTLDIGKLVIQ